MLLVLLVRTGRFRVETIYINWWVRFVGNEVFQRNRLLLISPET